MIVTLPLRLTGFGRYNSRTPNYVDIVYINGNILNNINIIDDSITTAPFTMTMSSGYDNNSIKITNIVGFDRNHLLKYCPKFHSTKPTIEFSYSDRTTNGMRDQSQCNLCRSSH